MNIVQEAEKYIKNGITYYFKDKRARALAEKAYSSDNPPPYPVRSVNGQTGDVVVSTGGARNIWYAVCSTATGTAAKTATSTSGDFALETGSMVRVKFTNTNNQPSATLSVDGTTAKPIRNLPSDSNVNTQWWRAGEVIDLVYDGTAYIMSDGGMASASYYGKTILSNSTSSASQTTAATSKAVKDAYDLADSKSDFSGDYNDLTNKPTIPTDTSDLTNGAGFVTAAGAAAAAPVQSVNGQTGTVVLDADDVGALPDSTVVPTDASIVDLIYPVGSIYMSVNSANPDTLFGGTWVQIEDTFLLAAGQTYTAGDTGGEATHTLTIDEMPNHNHTVARGGGTGTAEWGIIRANTIYSPADENRISHTGGGQPHNNMPPYLVVYIWKRTA